MKNFLYTTFIILLIIVTHSFASGQSSYGVSFGAIIGNNGDLLKSKKDSVNTFRNGYQIGLKADFGAYSFYISPSVFYEDITIYNSFKNINPFQKSPSLKIGKAKLVFGYQTNLVTKNIKFKIGGGLNGNYVLNISQNNENLSFNDIKDVYAAYNIDVELDVFFVNLSVSYEKSLKEVYVNTPNHKYDLLVFSAGVMF